MRIFFCVDLLFQSDYVLIAGVYLGKADGQVVGFRSGIDKKAYRQLFWHGADQPLCTKDDVVVQEAIVCVQDAHLLASCPHDVGMAVAH